MQARDSLIFWSSSAVFVPLHTGTLLFIFLYVEYTNWAKNIEITTRFLYLQCFSDVSTSALEIIQSYAAAHADQPKMPICWYLECFYFLQPAVIHLCKNRYFWPNVFCCFFRLKTSSKMRMKPPFFNVTFTNKKIPSKNIIGGNQKKVMQKMPWIYVFHNIFTKKLPSILPTAKRRFFFSPFPPNLAWIRFFLQPGFDAFVIGDDEAEHLEDGFSQGEPCGVGSWPGRNTEGLGKFHWSWCKRWIIKW